jgi:hypothetical protein
MVKETMLALAHLYRDLAKQMEELEAIREASLVDPSPNPQGLALLPSYGH